MYYEYYEYLAITIVSYISTLPTVNIACLHHRQHEDLGTLVKVASMT